MRFSILELYAYLYTDGPVIRFHVRIERRKMLFGTARNFRVTTALIVTAAVVMIAGCGGAPPEQPPAETEPEPVETPQPVLMDAEVAAILA